MKRRVPFARILIALAFIPSLARAETFFAPVGGRAITLGPDRVVCTDAADLHGWTVEPGGHALRPPVDPDSIGVRTTVATAPDVTHCTGSTASIGLVPVGAMPVVDRASVTIALDEGTVTLRGHGLRGMDVHWSAGGRSGDDVCTDPTPTSAAESCTVAIARDLPADPASIALIPLPAGTPGGTDPIGFDAQGLRLDPATLALHPARVVIARVLAAGAAIDVEGGDTHVALVHADAIAGVDCTDALCDVDGTALVVRGARGVGDSLEVRVRLRPHVFVARGTATDATLVAQVPVRRCPLALATTPLRGITDQRVVVRVGGGCAGAGALTFSVDGDVARAERVVDLGDTRLIVVRVAHVEGDTLAMTVRRDDTVVGVATAETHPVPPVRARLELEDLGPIDFIPTNRDARVLLPADVAGVVFVPVTVPGVYTVSDDGAAAARIRGVENAAGSVALRIAARDPSLPATLRAMDLAVMTEPVERPIHAANVPVALGSAAMGREPLIELVCGDGAGNTTPIVPGTTVSRPFRARATCRVVLHRERLRREDGSQLVHLTIDLVGVDGATKADAHVDQRVVLRPRSDPRILYVTGVDSPFDRVIVRASLAADDAHYAFAPDEATAAPQVQWSVVFGDDHFRIYATTAIPTGLFRIADPDHTGILTLNAGALLRAVWLSREGHESPIGLEAGIMWLGIAGDDARFSPHGQVALVAGLGIGVPIANSGHVSQTSINLHLWFEYEVSRQFESALPDPTAPGGMLGPGSPFGVVFGPSISIGDIGVNL